MKLRHLAMAVVTGAFAFALASCSSKNAADAATDNNDATEVADESAAAVITLAEGEEIAPSANKLVVIDFNATWCGPCKKFGPNFEAVAEQNRGKAVFYSVDTDAHPELAQKYSVESIPMVVYVKPDGTVDSSVGYMDQEEFAAAVAAHL